MPTVRGTGDLPRISDGDLRQSGPTALRMLVGAYLRQLRESREITREAAGYVIRSSHSKISRLECGRTSFKLRDVADLLTLYGVDEAERQTVLIMAKQANAPGWWQDYRDVLPDWFDAYLGLEQDAAIIRTYGVQFVPGLLQTEDYARAVIADGYENASAEQIERRVAVRMRRQQILMSPTSRKLWVVMDEAALRRQVGGSTTMRSQLEHLLEMAVLRHVTLQVLPFSSGSRVGGVGPITLLRFAQAELDDVVYLEQLASAQYLSKESDVRPYRHLLNQLGVHAQSAAESRTTLRQIISTL
ncbi:helix-turn-helix transcriptional regulator [Nonomuraea sp. NPDC049129]|uniref:helix-turn-helix domain-containing protein n=1 Tax=Nonomuraea sp. NPDC049129 TaxID=3155272 RepID=UPI00340BDE9F